MKNDEYINNNPEKLISDESVKEMLDDTAYDADTVNDNSQSTENIELNEALPFSSEEENESEYEEEEDGFSVEKDTDLQDSETIEINDCASASEVQAPSEIASKSTKAEPSTRRIDSIFDFIELFVFTLAVVFILTSFVFKYSTVKGDSMQNTLQSEEKLLLTSLFYNPKPGDIVVVQDRTTALKDPIVKRIIAIGGQKVKITRTEIWVDDQLLEEDYVFIDDTKFEYNVDKICNALMKEVGTIGYQSGNYYEFIVPDNEIFVMGDHRNNSMDSRDIGTLHEDAIIGKVVLRFAPFNKFGKID